MVFKLATDEMREIAGERGGDRKQRMVSKECAVHEVKEKKRACHRHSFANILLLSCCTTAMVGVSAREQKTQMLDMFAIAK